MTPNTIKLKALRLLAPLLFVSSLAAAAEELRLPNGLTIQLSPSPAAGKTAIVTLIEFGNDHDPEGYSGMAHLIEHLYVTGATPKQPARTAEQFMKSYPEGWNAQTGNTFTVIATVFPPDQLAAEIEDAALRMHRLQLTKADLQREVPRVVEELENMFGRFPHLGASNRARDQVRPSIPGGRYGGVPDQVRKITLEQVNQLWESYYKPINTRVVIVGTFDPKLARQLLRQHFGSIEPGLPAPKPSRRPRPRVGKVDEVTVSSRLPGAPGHAALAFRAPQQNSPEYAGFLVAVTRLMAAGRSQDLQVSYPLLIDPDVCVVQAPLLPDEAPQAGIARLRQFVDLTLRPAPTATDFTQTRNAFGFPLRLTPDTAMAFQQNPYGVALALGRQAQLGFDSKKLLAALRKVNASALQRVRKSYFHPKRSGAAVVTPLTARNSEDQKNSTP